MKYIISNKYIESHINGDILEIKFKDKIYEFLVNNKENASLFQILDHANQDTRIKVLMITNNNNVFNIDKYHQFLSNVLDKKTLSSVDDFPIYQNKHTRLLELRNLNKLIRYILKLNKLCIACAKGNIVTPFFGLYLASDIRVASDNTCFILDHSKFGLHPSGALPFFLTEEVGYTKAIEIMLSSKITALMAQKWGIVNEIFSLDNYYDNCLRLVHNYSNAKYSTIVNTKRLSKYSRKTFNNYIEYESSLLNLG